MPIFERGYRSWEGELTARRLRWWPIAATVIRLQLHSWWFWLLFGIGFLRQLGYFVQIYFASLGLGRQSTVVNDAFLLQALDVRLFWSVMIAALVGATQIANDRRSNALAIYLSRSITRLDYAMGKAVGVAILLSLNSVLPFLVMWGEIGLFADSIEWAGDNLGLLGRGLSYGLLQVVACTLLALGISCLFRRGWHAAMAWFGLFTFGTIVGEVLLAHGLRLDGALVLSVGWQIRRVGAEWMGDSLERGSPIVAGVALAILLALSSAAIYRHVRSAEIVS